MSCCVLSSPTLAEETWTELGGYVFASHIKGDSYFRDATVDVDVTFKDIIEDLDVGAMVFMEHRRGKWSFVGDAGHMTVSDGATATEGAVIVSLDAEVKQTTAQGFVGYRVFEKDYDNANVGLDAIGGVRYVFLEAEIGVEASVLGCCTASASRSRNEDWADGVVGVRVQYNDDNGWGVSLQADVGKGSDSTSYQLIGLASYDFKNNWKVFGGYQFLNLDYEAGTGDARFGVDLDYYGPRFGASYRF